MDRREEIGGAPPESPGPVSAKSPYPGLRSFAREEADVFFGRDRCIGGMTETLQNTRFLAVLGPSGSGKSSLVRSGLFMHLEAGLARKAGARWTFLDIRHPRTTPFAELARLTLESERAPDPEGKAPEPSRTEIEERRKALARDPFALVRWWTERPGRHPDENLLLLVDQFEELFGYSTDRERNEVEAFIDLLLESAGQGKVPVYVVITMRSEFLGGCSLFPGLAEQINASLSLTPRMTREECREAIAGPAFGGDLVLEDVLVTAILNDMNSLARFDEPAEGEGETEAEAPEISQADLIARRADQLPLMQHVLNWMWNIQAHGPDARPGEPIRLTLEQYLALGRLRGAMNLHADDVMAGTGDPEAVSRIFRALTDQPTVATSGSAESSAVRRRRTIAQLAAEADVPPDRVRAIVDAYRAEGVSMLNPDPETFPRLEDGDEVDISHESLIRQWGALRGWIRDEGEAGRSWQELLRDVDKGQPITGLDLSERKGWWERTQPHAGWADRYTGRFAEVDGAMNRSIRREWRRKMLLRGATASGVALAAMSYVAVAGAWELQDTAEREAAAARVDKANARRDADAAARDSARAESRAAAAASAQARAQDAADKARKTADEARKTAEAARAAAATAARQVQLASVQLSVARKEGAEIQQRSQLLSNRIAERTKGQLGLVLAKPPSDAALVLQDVTKDLELLRDTDPPAFAAIEPERERRAGLHSTYRLETGEMRAAAGKTQESLTSAGSGPGANDALRLSQAVVLQGRAERMEGKEAEALASFERAVTILPPDDDDVSRAARAEAQYERAALLFDSGRQAEAAGAAQQCLDSLPAPTVEEYLGRRESGLALLEYDPVKTRVLLGQVQCRTLLAASAPSDRDVSGEWREVSNALKMSARTKTGDMIRSVDHSRARSEAIVRYFRKQKKPYAKSWPAELEDSLSAGFEGLLADDEDGNSAGIVIIQPGQFYPLDALHRVEANNALMRWYADGGAAEQLPLADALLVMKVNQGLTRSLPGSEVAAGMVRRVSDAYLDHGDNWIDLYGRLDSRSYDQVDSTFDQAVSLLHLHWMFLGADRADIGESDRAMLLGRLRRQGQRLVAAARENLESERYGTLLNNARNLHGSICYASTDADCLGLAAEIAQVERDSAEMVAKVASPLLAGARPEPVWADSAQVALGGFDPVTCFDSAGSMRVNRANQQQARAPASASRQCSMGRGRLQYSIRLGGQVWLFERQENLERFRKSPAQFAPRLGGYDFREIAKSRKDRPDVTNNAGIVFEGRLYLAQTYGQAVNPEEIARAESNWSTLKSAPETDPNAGESMADPNAAIEDAAEQAAVDAIESLESAADTAPNPPPDAPAPDDPTAPEAAMPEPRP
ncbi:MAG TPA: ATP-binding protein [Allosphingosinicella sp.]